MKIFFAGLLPFMFAVIVAQVQFNRDPSEISFANFHKLAERFLNATGLVGLIFEDISGCSMKCLHHPKCVSFNSGGSGRTSCKIFGVDRFANGLSLVKDASYHYYYIKGACDDNPCANNGTCVTYDDDRSNFTCKCSRIFTGKTCSEPAPCSGPLGMEDGRIQDSQLSMSSYFNGQSKYGETRGRLNNNIFPQGSQTNKSDPNPWYKIDLLQVKNVTAVGIQGYGYPGTDEWTKTIMVSTTTDGSTWKTYQEIPGIDKVFPANTDSNNEVYATFTSPIEARAIKIFAKTCHTYCTFRLEIYGCI